MNTVKSISYSQAEILGWIVRLHCPLGFHADFTYGNGGFYKGPLEFFAPPPEYRFDKDGGLPGVVEADFANLPLSDSVLENAIFDPPFLTYIKAAREGNGEMVMARRFGGYWTYQELSESYQGALREAARVIAPKGFFIVKCQDIIHNHRMHCTHANVIRWAESEGFRLADIYLLLAKHRMPANPRGQQKHARVHHSYFLVFQKR